MRHLRQLCAACVLTLAIALSASAGNMEAGITDPQPPSATVQGNMETTGSSTVTNTAIEVALSLFQTLLTLV
jgi:hypothetical protein